MIFESMQTIQEAASGQGDKRNKPGSVPFMSSSVPIRSVHISEA